MAGEHDHLTHPANSAGVTDLHQGIQHACAKAHDTPGLIALESIASGGTKTTYYLWVDGTGDLRIHNAYPTDQDADGTIVGTQS